MTQILLMSSILFSRLAAMLARWTGALRTFADPVCNMLPFSGFIIWSSLSQIFLEKIHFYHVSMRVLPKKAKNLFTSNQTHFSINVKQSCFRLNSKFQEYNYPTTVPIEMNDSKYQFISEYSRIFWSHWNTLFSYNPVHHLISPLFLVIHIDTIIFIIPVSHLHESPMHLIWSEVLSAN